VREWLVGGALVEDDAGHVLLVQNRRRDGSHDWSPPGGVIDEGETLLEGLTREVAEETGLIVSGWIGPAYEVVIEAPGLGWRLRVEAWRATGFTGEVRIDDPDGIVVDVRFVAPQACAPHLDGCPAWVREPLSEWLAGRWDGTRSFGFDIDGGDRASMIVTRRP
jgi:8-oxo-dGTP diphosphatase